MEDGRGLRVMEDGSGLRGMEDRRRLKVLGDVSRQAKLADSGSVQVHSLVIVLWLLLVEDLHDEMNDDCCGWFWYWLRILKSKVVGRRVGVKKGGLLTPERVARRTLHLTL